MMPLSRKRHWFGSVPEEVASKQRSVDGKRVPVPPPTASLRIVEKAQTLRRIFDPAVVRVSDPLRRDSVAPPIPSAVKRHATDAGRTSVPAPSQLLPSQLHEEGRALFTSRFASRMPVSTRFTFSKPFGLSGSVVTEKIEKESRLSRGGTALPVVLTETVPSSVSSSSWGTRASTTVDNSSSRGDGGETSREDVSTCDTSGTKKNGSSDTQGAKDKTDGSSSSVSNEKPTIRGNTKRKDDARPSSSEDEGNKSKRGSSSENTEKKLNKWSCTTCFLVNPPERTKCMACESPNPGVQFKPLRIGLKLFPNRQMVQAPVPIQPPAIVSAMTISAAVPVPTQMPGPAPVPLQIPAPAYPLAPAPAQASPQLSSLAPASAAFQIPVPMDPRHGQQTQKSDANSIATGSFGSVASGSLAFGLPAPSTATTSVKPSLAFVVPSASTMSTTATNVQPSLAFGLPASTLSTTVTPISSVLAPSPSTVSKNGTPSSSVAAPALTGIQPSLKFAASVPAFSIGQPKLDQTTVSTRPNSTSLPFTSLTQSSSANAISTSSFIFGQPNFQLGQSKPTVTASAGVTTNHDSVSIFGKSNGEQSKAPFSFVFASSASSSVTPSPFGVSTTSKATIALFGAATVSSTAAPTPFGVSTASKISATPFGVATTSSNAAPTPFGAATASSNVAPTPFGAATASSNAAPTPFGAATASSNVAPTPFGFSTTSKTTIAPFGASTASKISAPPFGVSVPASSKSTTIETSTPFGIPVPTFSIGQTATSNMNRTASTSSFAFGQQSSQFSQSKSATSTTFSTFGKSNGEQSKSPFSFVFAQPASSKSTTTQAPSAFGTTSVPAFSVGQTATSSGTSFGFGQQSSLFGQAKPTENTTNPSSFPIFGKTNGEQSSTAAVPTAAAPNPFSLTQTSSAAPSVTGRRQLVAKRKVRRP